MSRQVFACNDLTMSVAGHQTLRVLDGSYVLDRPADVTEVIPRADVLAVVFGPDGSTLAAGGVPVWVVSSYDGDLVPTDRLDEASEVLQAAGHQVRR